MDEEPYPPHYVLLAAQLAPSVLGTMATPRRACRQTPGTRLAILSSSAERPRWARLRQVARARAALKRPHPRRPKLT